MKKVMTKHTMRVRWPAISKPSTPNSTQGPKEALEVIPRLPMLYDEPFADPSQIPTYLLCVLTREHVTVALSGDGGDELFGGYYRHFWAPRVWKWTHRLPKRVKTQIAMGLTRRHLALARYYEKISPLLPWRYQVEMTREKIPKLADIFGAASLDAMYERLRAHGDASVCLPGNQNVEKTIGPIPIPHGLHPAERMMYRDMMEYLPDDILVKVDRAGMGASLEVRAPYLDHRVVEFAWNLPLKLKLRGWRGKMDFKAVVVPLRSRLADPKGLKWGSPSLSVNG